jgi:hypothetical protein
VLDQRSELLDAPEVELLVEDFVDQAHHAALLKEPACRTGLRHAETEIEK